MALNVTCAGCQSVYPVAETLIGKTIRCKKCGEMMPVAPVAKVAKVAKAVVAAPAKAVAARPAARAVVEDMDDIRPSRPARRQRDDDGDARPAPEKKKSALPLILAGGVVLLVLAGGGAAAAIGFGLLGTDTKPTTVVEGTSGGGGPILGPSVGVGGNGNGNGTNNGTTATPPTSKGSGEAATPPTKKTETPAPVVPGASPTIRPVDPGVAAGGPSAGQRLTLDSATLAKTKSAAVYFEVETTTGAAATGSGWFGIEQNLIFTNAHVLFMTAASAPKPAKITVTINPGTPGEKVIPHNKIEILAVDRDRDLALLQVHNETGLPAPLPVRPSSELTETERLFVAGYPAGKKVALQTRSTKAPSVTVNGTSVGAIRRDDDGNISAVQISGGAYRGNSGGPIVDPDGRVCAVLVAGAGLDALGAAVQYGVPTEYVTGLVAGRVADIEYGQAYRKDGKIHIPVTANCLDPFGRLKSVGVGYWVGDTAKKTRPPGPERTGTDPADADFREVTLTYKHTKEKSFATGELVFPELPSGRSYWVQPFYSNALVTKQWLAGNPLVLTGPPVDLEPADLIVRYKPNTRRPVTLTNASSLEEFEEGEDDDISQRLLIETEIKLTETVQRASDQGAVASLLLNYEKVALKGQIGPLKINDMIPKDIRGLFTEGIKQTQGLAHVNRDGKIYKSATNVRSVGRAGPLFQALSDVALDSLDAGSIRIPNVRAAAPGLTWTDVDPVRFQLTIFDGSELIDEPRGGPAGPGGRPAARPRSRTKEYKYLLETKHTYLGTRVRLGSKEAVVKIEGKVTTPPGVAAGSGASGVIKGSACIDLETGMVVDSQLDIDFQMDTSSDGIKKRLSGINKYRLSRGSSVSGT